MNGILVIVLILVGVIGLYILTYYLNGKTEAPLDIELPGCETCGSLSCSLKGKSTKDIDPEQCEIEKLN